MTFSYFRFPLSKPSDFFGQSVSKPIIPVGIATKENGLIYAALVDSGADFCIFDSEIGEALGLPIKQGRRMEFGGVHGGKVAEAFLHDVLLTVGGHAYRTTVGFSFDLAPYGHGILGQKGLFDQFVVTFDAKAETIELVPRP